MRNFLLDTQTCRGARGWPLAMTVAAACPTWKPLGRDNQAQPASATIRP